jgi:excisionase family DNA binding protein
LHAGDRAPRFGAARRRQWTGSVHVSVQARTTRTRPHNPLSANTLIRSNDLAAALALLLPLVVHTGGHSIVNIDSAETTLEPRLGRSVSIDQAASLLNVSRRTIYNRIREGRLLTIRTLGGSQRVLVESLVELGFRPQAFPASAAQASFAARQLSR